MSAWLPCLVFAGLLSCASAECEEEETGPKICDPDGARGFIFPLPGHPEAYLDNRAKVFLYCFGMLYCFVGVSIVADMFMAAIERITSKTRRVKVPGTNRMVTTQVWNETVANLTLMALGSSAPEILLSINDIVKREFFAGAMGPSTIVGSAAFNLFVIVAVCINAIPPGETRQIKETGVFFITAVFSVFAYIWLLFIVQFSSKNVIEVWEGVMTFLFFPALVWVSYAADVGILGPLFGGAQPPKKDGDDDDSDTKSVKSVFTAISGVSGFNGPGMGMTSASRAPSVRSRMHSDVDSSEDEEDDLLVVCLTSILARVDAWGSRCKKYVGKKKRWLRRVRNWRRIFRKEKGDLTEDDAEDSEHEEERVEIFDLEEPDNFVLDDDGEPLDNPAGIIVFKSDTLTVVGDLEERKYTIPVLRKNGEDGRVSCRYHMERLSAAPGYDYVDEEGQVDFKNGVSKAEITITILPKAIGEKNDQFQLILEEPTNDAIFNPNDDGGDEKALMTITILNANPKAIGFKQKVFHVADTLVNVDEIVLGFESWKDQIIESYYCNGSPEEQEEASTGDWIMHVVCFPWKMAYAILTPPPTFWGGKVCFVVSLIHIGFLTAMVGDLAELFGCAAGVPDSITAITFVALGTSVPDLFASKTAAQQDEWADASIVNVTGSNSVNVFLGIGLPWMMASIYWKMNGFNSEWLETYGADYLGAYPDGAFIVESGDLAFSVIVFTIFALSCLFVIRVRRVIYGGELGGPQGSDAKACSSFFMIMLWFFYIALVIWKTTTCTTSALSQLIAILTVVPIVAALMIFFMLMLQLLKISKDYIGEEGFFGIFVAVSVLALRLLYFFMFQ